MPLQHRRFCVPTAQTAAGSAAHPPCTRVCLLARTTSVPSLADRQTDRCRVLHVCAQVSEDPCLLLADRFLSPQECEAVRALGGPYLKRSKVSAGGWVVVVGGGGGGVTGVPTAARRQVL